MSKQYTLKSPNQYYLTNQTGPVVSAVFSQLKEDSNTMDCKLIKLFQILWCL
ncbi:hypothetical protein NARC_50191 [Candidatus Nitrosocosmicus arcticus]|uniref:Uncharacterized protein n=1 Tax=Candidatus Nitrosocosmicus arcticus TaxID=2035267 RepID=A0A557SWN0_9ARCH|nr:hypothetical protein NARC_50191 [Candidatus Nitrosocosmicus arcticus]